VTDIDAARRLLLERGVEVGEIRHKDTARSLGRRVRTGPRSRAGRLRQLCQLFRPGRQGLGATRTRLSSNLILEAGNE
jgi:hypothetical protein